MNPPAGFFFALFYSSHLCLCTLNGCWMRKWVTFALYTNRASTKKRLKTHNTTIVHHDNCRLVCLCLCRRESIFGCCFFHLSFFIFIVVLRVSRCHIWEPHISNEFIRIFLCLIYYIFHALFSLFFVRCRVCLFFFVIAMRDEGAKKMFLQFDVGARV